MMTADDERDFLNHWMMFGAASVVTKVGKSHWTIWNGKPGFPLSKTKREAMERANAYAIAVSHRRAGI